MICYKCGHEDVKYFNTRVRTIRTLNGLKEIKTQDYKCEKCYRTSNSGHPLAPFGSMYGWDVINYVVEQRKKGVKLCDIQLDLIRKTGFTLALSTLSTFYTRHR